MISISPRARKQRVYFTLMASGKGGRNFHLTGASANAIFTSGMSRFFQLALPAALLGAVLLLGERHANPPEEASSQSLSAAADDRIDGTVPCPSLLPERLVVAMVAVRATSPFSSPLKTEALIPEARSLSPPRAA